MTTRNLIPMVLVAEFMFAGCHSPVTMHSKTAMPSVAAPPSFHSMLITTLGSYTSHDGIWRVGASEDALDLTHSTAAHGDGKESWDSISLTRQNGWRKQIGWFVFIESESRIWAYDGGRRLTLNTETPDGSKGATYFSPRFSCAVPEDVLSRLSESARKNLQTP